MADGNRGAVEQIVLTASGGPFRTWSMEEMAAATPEAALKHPVWSMGAKICIDSATLMNKGLELIEAARLFEMDEADIGVLVHPQSVIHGLVYYRDGSVLAQLGARTCGSRSRTRWPGRADRDALAAAGSGGVGAAGVLRARYGAVSRAAPGARGAARRRGAPTILSAANEMAVEAFLQRRIGFLDIAGTVERVMDAMGAPPADTLDAVLEMDAEARRRRNALRRPARPYDPPR